MLRLRTLAPVGWICLAALWLILAGHTSASPVVFGRWSRGMALVVAAGAALVVLAALPAALLLFFPQRFEPKCARALGAVRRRPWLALPLSLGPLAVWAAALAYLVNVDLPFALRAWLAFGAFTALLAVWLAALLFADTSIERDRTLPKKLLMAVTSLLLAITAIEGAGALLGLAPPSKNLNPPGLNVEFATAEFNTRVVTNRQGLREGEIISARPSGERRVAFIGDSVTFGWGVESDETFVRRAETSWRDGGNIRAINAGKPGASLADYLRVLRDDAPAWQADWIVLGFLVGNDCPVAAPVSLADERAVELAADDYLRRSTPEPAVAFLRRSLLLGALHRGLQALLRWNRNDSSVGRRGPLFGEANPLDETSLAAQIASPEGKREFASRYAARERDGWIDKGRSWQVNPWLLRSALLDPSGAASALGEVPATKKMLRYEWLLCEKLLDAIVALAKAQGARLCILALPSPYQASGQCRLFLREVGGQAPESLAEARTVNRWLAEYCRQREILFVDTIDALSDREKQDRDEMDRSERGSLFFPWDGHPTSAGHEIIAQQLLAALPLNPPTDESLEEPHQEAEDAQQ